MSAERPYKPRTSKAELERRLEFIMPMVIDGYGFAEIREILTKYVHAGNGEAFQVANSTLSDYIERCKGA